MYQPQTPPRSVALVTHPHLPKALTETRLLEETLRQQGVSVVSSTSYSDESFRAQIVGGGFDLLITLGGDGTVLRTARLCVPQHLPILGINVGKFGFLTEVHHTSWKKMLPRLLSGDYRLEERMMLHAAHWRNQRMLQEWDVLNEIVVCRGRYVRPVHLKASVDGNPLTTYVADGVIAATATGSTAYALAAGGPILPPELRNILLIPVAPHLSLDRAIVLSEGSAVTIQVNTSHEAVVSADGQPPVVMKDGDEVRAEAGAHPVTFIRFQEQGYFYRTIAQYMEQNPRTNGDA